MVTPGSLQITSRGRVAFHVMPVGQLGQCKLNGDAASTADANQLDGTATVMAFLAPEFQQSMGHHQQRMSFSESDIEKVKIGEHNGVDTLRRIYILKAHCIAALRNGRRAK